MAGGALGDDNLVVAEVDENPDLYEDGHIPGAVKLHWRDDLQDPIERDIVEKAEFERLMGARGIAQRHERRPLRRQEQLVRRLRVLVSEDLRPRGCADRRRRPAEVDRRGTGADDGDARACLGELHARRMRTSRSASGATTCSQGLENGGGRALVDVRSPQEYSGELMAPPGYEQEGASRTGHIPSAQSIPWAQAVRDDGTFKSPDELRELYGAKGVTPEKEVLAYCRIGERSAHTWFVLRELLGYPDVKNYDGSWTEWGNLVDVPIER